MKLIGQSHQVIDRDDMAPAQLIELCGRTCYKSEDKITEVSADKFARMLAKRGHLSVIEHGALALVVQRITWLNIKLLVDHEYIKFLNISPDSDRHIISGNLRAWLEFLKNVELHNQLPEGDLEWLKYQVWDYCPAVYEAIFGVPSIGDSSPDAIKLGIIDPENMTADERELHEFKSVKFVTNRGVTHELVRHRPASYSQESTRYVNYGGKEMECIEPIWFNEEGDENSPEYTFFLSCENAETAYAWLLGRHNWRPEQAREVLSNALKTEIVVTANIKEWRHILNLRTSKAAHPQIRDLMKPLKAELFGGKGDEVQAA